MTAFYSFVNFFLRRKPLLIFLVFLFFLGLGVSTVYRGALNTPKRTDLTVYIRGAEAIRAGENIYTVRTERSWNYIYLPLTAVILSFFTGTPFTLFLVLLVFYFYTQKRPAWAGILLALAIVLKTSPVGFIVFFFLFKREWEICLWILFGLCLWILASPSFFIGWERNSNHTIAVTMKALSVAALAGLAWLCGKNKTSDKVRLFAEYSLFPMTMLFFSPASKMNHFTVLFILFAAACLTAERFSRQSAIYRFLAAFFFPQRFWRRSGSKKRSGLWAESSPVV